MPTAPKPCQRMIDGGRRAGGALAIALVACSDSASGPAIRPITTADVSAVTALSSQVQTLMANPALVSVLGVTVPFSVRVAAGPRSSPMVRVGLALKLSPGPAASFLGDVPVNPAYLGATFVRAGAVFRRDTARRDAPANAVRVLLYERLAGASTGIVVGWMDVSDSVRGNGRRVTRGFVGTPSSPSLASVRGSFVLVPQGAFGNGFHDVLQGSISAGAQPLTVADSFVVYTATGDAGRNVITTTMASLNAVVRSVSPAAPGAPASTSRLTITAGGRTVRIEAQRTGSNTILTFYNDSEIIGSTTTANLPNLGDAAHAAAGGAVSDVVRLWMNAIGQLLVVTPAAADLAQGAGNLMALLDPAIP